MIDIQRFWPYWWKKTIKFDSLYIGSLGKVFILNCRNICSFLMNSRFLVHRYWNQLRIAFRTRARLVCHLVYFLLSLRTHRKLWICVAMNSRTARQKLFVQTRNENIEIELVPFVFRSFVGVFVRIQEARKKGDFQCILFFWTFEIIKIRIARKVSRYSLWTTDFIYTSADVR